MMIVVDKQALTRFARCMRTAAAAFGIEAGHSAFLETASAALGFRSLNAAVAHLRERPIVIGLPARHHRTEALWFSDFYASYDEAPLTHPLTRRSPPYLVHRDKAAVQAARFIQASTAGGTVSQSCLQLLTGAASPDDGARRFRAGDWEAGTLVAPDTLMSVPTMAREASARFAAVEDMASPKGDWHQEAFWQGILVDGLCKGVMSVEPGMRDSPLLQSVMAAMNQDFGPGHRGVEWSEADGAVAGLLRRLGVQADRIPTVRADLMPYGDHDDLVFDAAAFLEGADILVLRDLVACNWNAGGNGWADEVALHVRHLPGYDKVDALLEAVEDEGCGFNVTVDPEQAMAWLATHRPADHATLLQPSRGHS